LTPERDLEHKTPVVVEKLLRRKVSGANERRLIVILPNGMIRDFPESAKLIQHIEFSLKTQPKVFDAFIKACTADDQPKTSQAKSMALKALKFGNPPLIVFGNGTAIANGKQVLACGYTNQNLGLDQLEIYHLWFEAFESGSPSDKSANARRLTTTILHEMVHWVRSNAKASNDIAATSFTFPEEAGDFFERLAFGGSNNCTPAEVTDSLFSMQK
jgi:hypothetical protein